MIQPVDEVRARKNEIALESAPAGDGVGRRIDRFSAGYFRGANRLGGHRYTADNIRLSDASVSLQPPVAPLVSARLQRSRPVT